MNPIAQPVPGRDSQTEPRADPNGGPPLGDPAVLARKRAFLTLEGHRKSLAARVPRMVRARTRYEGLCLAKMVTRLQRDYLSQSTTGGDRSGLGGAGAETLCFRAVWSIGGSCCFNCDSVLVGLHECWAQRPHGEARRSCVG